MKGGSVRFPGGACPPAGLAAVGWRGVSSRGSCRKAKTCGVPVRGYALGRALLEPPCRRVHPAHVSEHFCVTPVTPGEECKQPRSYT